MDYSFFLSPFQDFIRIQPIGFDALSQIRRIRLFGLIPLVLMLLVILPLEFLRRCSVAFILFLILCYGIWRIQDLYFPVMDIYPHGNLFAEFLLRYRFVTPGSFVPPRNRNDQIQIRKCIEQFIPFFDKFPDRGVFCVVAFAPIVPSARIQPYPVG